MIPNFFYRPEMLEYDFGSFHPLRPERLKKTIEVLDELHAIEPIASPPAKIEDLLRVHDMEYIEAVQKAGTIPNPSEKKWTQFGLGTEDNPIFEKMHEKALWYVGGSVAAAEKIRDGEKISFNLSGGLHHAHRNRASGFCIYNDPAIMISILRERFEKVAYIDIDVHHGDGVQWIYYDDPTVMTISIHESGRTLFPGTGFVNETGAENTSINIPLEAYTTGDVWVWAFKEVVPRALEKFVPHAIVLQMGADAHFDDPLAHLLVSVQEWLEAVRIVKSFGLPIAACGGGGYNLSTVPRMWSAACILLGEENSSIIERFYDSSLPQPREQGKKEAERVVKELLENVLK
ncbi:MAG TPA: acetoin utilization protein AcuC [Fimbriimonadales bacterium]|nr:acetoin utilization protein AcuC [Fimbriimonadales bacterium]